MNRLTIIRPETFDQASQAAQATGKTGAMLKAGGMDVLDHLKEGLAEPEVLVDVKRLRFDGAREPISRSADGTLRIEANATLTEIAELPLIREVAPVLSQSVEGAATPQVRNVATAAGNLLQRPRCWYYRNDQFDCNKKGGDMCFARHGENKYHAIFWSGPCVIVHPSNLAPALQVCNATVHVIGGRRDTVPIADLFHMPDQGVLDEHNLETGEVVTHITCDASPVSGFYAVKEKQSFDWPLAMAAVTLRLSHDRIEGARICAGAVAPIPWHLPKVEQALLGVNIDDDAKLRAACAVAVDGAVPLEQNAYKLKLLPVVVRRAILRAAGRDEEMDA